MSTGIIVFAHGSRVESANEAVRAVARGLVLPTGTPLVRAAFLELGVPDMAGAARELIQLGATRVVVLPYFLTLGLHMERDLPVLVAGIVQEHPGIKVEVAPPLDGHPALIQVLTDRFQEITNS